VREGIDRDQGRGGTLLDINARAALRFYATNAADASPQVLTVNR
jgi:hypothetical protein